MKPTTPLTTHNVRQIDEQLRRRFIPVLVLIRFKHDVVQSTIIPSFIASLSFLGYYFYSFCAFFKFHQ